MNPATITPYLMFGGRCDEAIAFYRTAVGAEVEMMMRFSECPDPVPPGMLPPGFENKVMHATLRIGGAPLMASDGRDEKSKSVACHLALSVKTEAEVHSIFAALSEGGEPEMPPGKTFWSSCFSMVTDKFGIGWMVSVA